MAFDFPSSPADGATSNGYTWSAAKGAWLLPAGSGSGGGSQVYTSLTPPPGAVDGAMWWKEDTGQMFIYYTDANSSQWVQVPSGNASRMGVVDGSNAAAGEIGEYGEINVLTGSPIALTTAVDAVFGSVTLQPGDWEINYNPCYRPAAATNYTFVFHSISLSAVADATTPGAFFLFRTAGYVPAADFNVGLVGPLRKNITVPTTIYFTARAAFSAGTMSVYGQARWRRAR